MRIDGIITEDGDLATVSRQWANRWLKRESAFITTLRSKPLLYLRRQLHKKEELEAHFQEFQRCRQHYQIDDADIYNFDETGCQIGLQAGSTVIVPTGTQAVYVDDPNNRELVTVTAYIGASGYAVPP